MPTPRVCVFDVNETLLDLGALDPHFKRVFGDAGMRRTWFNQLLQSALVSTVLNRYSDFGTIGGAALTMVAARQGVELAEDDRKAILGAMRELPPHADVREGPPVDGHIAEHYYTGDDLGMMRQFGLLPEMDTCAIAVIRRPSMELLQEKEWRDVRVRRHRDRCGNGGIRGRNDSA